MSPLSFNLEKKQGDLYRTSLGRIRLHTQAIRSIIFNALSEMESFHGVYNPGIRGFFSRVARRQAQEGIRVRFTEHGIAIALNVVLKGGRNIHDVSPLMQELIKEKVEHFTELPVLSVDIDIREVAFQKL
jgi:uncharacterized alkaline shock family protein YloU